MGVELSWTGKQQIAVSLISLERKELLAVFETKTSKTKNFRTTHQLMEGLQNVAVWLNFRVIQQVLVKMCPNSHISKENAKMEKTRSKVSNEIQTGSKERKKKWKIKNK